MGQQMPAQQGGTPAVVRTAGALVAAEGAVGAAAAIRVGWHLATGFGAVHAGRFGGTAFLVGSAALVLYSGIELIRGRWWPRTTATIAQILLFGLAWLAVTTGHPGLGIPLGVLTLIVLGLLFSPPSNRWMATPYDLSPQVWHPHGHG
ncbi:hypothetical protein [Nocardia sp. NPDC004722]